MAIRITRVYTRQGDAGRTRLVGGASVRKDAPRVEAYGTVDELGAALGLARAFNEKYLSRHRGRGRGARAARELDGILTALQNELFDLGAELATPPAGAWPGMPRVSDEQVRALEARIDLCQRDLAPLRSFVLAGGGPVGAFLHQARTICRRAERRVLAIRDGGRAERATALRYLNRLSDLLFVLARWIALHTGEEEPLWERGLRLDRDEARRARPASPASTGRGRVRRPAPSRRREGEKKK